MFWKSVGFKLIFLIVAFSIICVGVFIFLLDRELRTQYEAGLMSQAREIGERVSRDVRDGMLEHGGMVNGENIEPWNTLRDKGENIEPRNTRNTRRNSGEDIKPKNTRNTRNVGEGIRGTSAALESIGYQSIVRNVRILDERGAVAASTDAREKDTFVFNSDSLKRKCELPGKGGGVTKSGELLSECFSETRAGERIANVTIGVSPKPGCSTASCHAGKKEARALGFVDVEISLKSVDGRLAVMRNKSMLFGFILVLGLALVGSAFIYEIIFLPLREIIKGTVYVANGNLDQTLPERNQSDEIGHLSRSFNKMTGRIREMTERLSSMNLELERKVAERTLELEMTKDSVMQSEKLASLGIMAAAIAHELNNPLTAVLTYTSLLERKAEEGSEAKEDLGVVVSETKRCREIIRGLLDFARESDFRQKPVNINNLLEKTIALLGPQVIFQDIEILTDYAEKVPEMIMDEDQVKQVFINIMLNAADAMPNGGKIYVRTGHNRAANTITAEFQDTGFGIPQQDLSKIFDPFFTTKEKGKGTGLGLSVSYGIVRRHGGTIEARSGLRKGTTFKITFPVKSPRQEEGGRK